MRPEANMSENEMKEEEKKKGNMGCDRVCGFGG